MQQIDPSISDLASAYVAYLQSKDEALQWSSFEVLDLCLEGPWDRLWQLVQALALLPDEPDPVVLATIAAGPLEDLLAKAGPEYISAVESLALTTPRAARMLTGVWRSSIAPDVWDRVVRFCRKVPNPLDGTYAY
jgi:hypothetical protein